MFFKTLDFKSQETFSYLKTSAILRMQFLKVNYDDVILGFQEISHRRKKHFFSKIPFAIFLKEESFLDVKKTFF